MKKNLVPVLSLLLVIAIVVAAVFGVQKNDLTNEVAALEAELNSSKSSVDTLTADLAAAQADLDASAAKVTELEASVADLTAQADTAAAKVTELETSAADLTAQTEASAVQVAELEANVAALTAQAETNAADLAAAQAALETANADLAAAQAALETANADLAAAKAELEATQADLAAVKAELEAAAPVVEEPAAEEPVGDPLATAFIMFADGSWVNQVWNPGETPDGITVTEAPIYGEGDYTVGLTFDTPAEGVAFTALGIANGEEALPGWKIKINEIRVNGEAITVGKGYTSSDDGVITRMNIFNEWVGELPEDARSWDGNTADANWVIINRDDFASVQSYEIDFSLVKYGIDTAYIMFADATWERQFWLDGNEYGGVTVKTAEVTGAGDYTVGLDFTTTEYGKAAGVAFTALGIKHGETLFPGMTIKINDIRVNGQSIAVAKGYTSSDDGLEMRMNVMNEWVGALPEDARSWDGTTEGSNWVIVDKNDFAEVLTYEIDFSLIPVTDTAFLMFASSDWTVSAWNPGEYAETNAVTVDGPGTYTLSLEFAEPLSGFAFLAAGIANGENSFPGYFMDVTEIKVNGEAIELAKDFTTTDDGVVTRSNIWNEWVGAELPAEARVADGNLEGATATIAAQEALSNVSTLEVTFDYIYGEPPAAEGPAPLTEDEVAALLAADYHGYVAVQSENYIFRNDWEDATYGLNGTSPEFFTHLTGWDATNNAVDYGGEFVDAVITGDGTYTATMTTGEMGFGSDSYFRYFRVATDIPAALVNEGYVTISDVTVKIGDGKTQSGVVVHTDGDWVKLVVTDEYNSIAADFGYSVPGANTLVTFTFTVSGLTD